MKNLIVGFLLALSLVVFLNQNFFLEKLPEKLGYLHYEKDQLTIAFSTPASSLSPYQLNLNNLTRTRNLYEGLVAFDSNLRIKPSLAISWGNLNEKTWEFKLRHGVKFHDGSAFNATSVVNSYERAKESESPLIKELIRNIEDIKVVEPYQIQIITLEPDPLILSKLTQLFITKEESIGTGPYLLTQWTKGETLNLKAFKDYWGLKPTYEKVSYIVIEDRLKREEAFSSGEVDILAAISRDQATNLPKEQIKNQYSLEVNFLMFQMEHPLLKDRKVREAIRDSIDSKEIEAIGNFFVRPANQFVAPGVFGYNASIETPAYSKENHPKNLFGEKRQKISIDYLNTYRTLVDYLEKQLEDTGFLIEKNVIPGDQLIEKIKNNRSPLFIVGWQAENGDAGGFLDNFIHSEGSFNEGRYKNPLVDRLIEESRREMNPAKRLNNLQKVMKIIDEDLIGIPLFESSRLYALKEGVDWKPRLDGLVLGVEVK